MEKYGVADDDMIKGLRDEEHNLMLKMSQSMLTVDKTASENSEMRSVESRLQDVRDKITEHDLKKMRQDG